MTIDPNDLTSTARIEWAIGKTLEDLKTLQSHYCQRASLEQGRLICDLESELRGEPAQFTHGADATKVLEDVGQLKKQAEKVEEARTLVRRCDGVPYDEPLENDVRAAIARWEAEKKAKEEAWVTAARMAEVLQEFEIDEESPGVHGFKEALAQLTKVGSLAVDDANIRALKVERDHLDKICRESIANNQRYIDSANISEASLKLVAERERVLREEARLHITNFIGLVEDPPVHLPRIRDALVESAREWLAKVGGPTHQVQHEFQDPGEASKIETPKDLNPGIRFLVEALNKRGLKTTDSGDGVTHDFACDRDHPYVVVQTSYARFFKALEIAAQTLTELGFVVVPMAEEELKGMECNIEGGTVHGYEREIAIINIELSKDCPRILKEKGEAT